MPGEFTSLRDPSRTRAAALERAAAALEGAAARRECTAHFAGGLILQKKAFK
jgi:hypothetical protein